MIKIFRKIRKKMADDNKPLKYMRYAIGEVVLVVIGILIALQINNWNEEKKDRGLEIEFLKRLKSDLVTDSTYYSRRIKDSESFVMSNVEFITELYKVQQNYSDVKKLFEKLKLSSKQLVSQNSTYLELINDGKLNLIRNTKLKSALIGYYRDNEEAGKHIEEFNTFSVNTMLNAIEKIPNMPRVLVHHLNIVEMNFKLNGQYDFVNDPNTVKFQISENLATVYTNKHKVFLDYFEDLQDQSNYLIDSIDSMLEN